MNLFSIELVKAFFPPGWHFILAHPDKTLSFYNDILLNHQSVLIKPITDKRDSNKVIYHSIYIHNIVSLDEWGNPSLLKKLPDHSIQYNYYDYIESWFKILLHENDKFTHSWFVQFDHKFKSVIPSWFARWWHQYGAIPDILPAELNNQVNMFSTMFKVNQHTSQFPVLMLFMIKYKVPWIVKWKYQLFNNIVSRQYLVKWWGQYNHQKIINQVQLEFPTTVKTPAQQTLAQLVHSDKQEPDSPTVSTIRLGSPAPGPSKQTKSKKKCSQLLMLSQQLIAQASQEEEDDSSDESVASNPYGSTFQDAQGPFA
ncbi:hypothetical protein RHMOL_Rhmol07G0206100 [Rhododendron molle]|uniref:Uncharacterized protein n=1 Tax=Rhododendron molle TaxID=49168 RepID=A0ACC0N3W8_RHOML|nr:hypothetical protein RHMOL_Rhmol07G0206100 [Rhododendron molle]